MPDCLASYKTRIAIAGILFLLVSQTLALLHSTEHFFHHADSLCSIYQSVEQSTPGIISPDLRIEIPPATDSITASYTQSNSASCSLAYHSRAPPLV